MKKTKTVLVAEDEENQLNLITQLLENENYRVLKAQNGQDALKLYKENNVDLILTDVKMPEMDGLKLLKTILKINPSQKVIVMTGYFDLCGMDKAHQLGAVDFIPKPLDIEYLKKVVRNIVERCT